MLNNLIIFLSYLILFLLNKTFNLTPSFNLLTANFNILIIISGKRNNSNSLQIIQ